MLCRYVKKILNDYISKVPNSMSNKIQAESASSLHIFRSQEIDRFNKLLKTMKKTMLDLIDAIDG